MICRFVCHGLNTGDNCVFRVKAVNAAGYSTYSNVSETCLVKAAIGESQSQSKSTRKGEEKNQSVKVTMEVSTCTFCTSHTLFLFVFICLFCDINLDLVSVNLYYETLSASSPFPGSSVPSRAHLVVVAIFHTVDSKTYPRQHSKP